MVRHQLPLHGARTCKGPDSSPSPRASRSRNIEEAKALGYQTRPVLVGPVTFLKLAKSKDAGFNTLSLLDRLLPVYIEVLRELADRGRGMGADRRAVPGARSRYRRAAGAAPCLCGNRQGRAAAQDHAGDLFRRGWATIATPRWRCPSPACISIWCARPSRLDEPAKAFRRTACCRSASSTAATSGARI